MSDIKIDLTLKDLDVNTASVIVAYLGGKSKAPGQEKVEPAKKAAPKKKAAAKKKPEPKIEVVDKSEDDDDDWDDDGKEDAGDDGKYASVKKWRELATMLVADGFNTEEKLLDKCQELRGTVPALEKIPDDNLVTRCGRAIELLGA